jgi:hypothetical protein
LGSIFVVLGFTYLELVHLLTIRVAFDIDVFAQDLVFFGCIWLYMNFRRYNSCHGIYIFSQIQRNQVIEFLPGMMLLLLSKYVLVSAYAIFWTSKLNTGSLYYSTSIKKLSLTFQRFSFPFATLPISDSSI